MQRLVSRSGSMEPLGRFTRTGPGSGSMEPLDRFNRTGPGSGSVEPLERFTRTGSGSKPRFLSPVHEVFFRLFHGSGNFFFGGFTVSRFGAVRNLSATVPVPVPSASAPVRFRVTRPVAMPRKMNSINSDPLFLK